MNELEINERLIGDNFRAFYNRPFYTWDVSKETREQLKHQYKGYIDELWEQNILTEDCPMATAQESRDYRINILRELLKDL